MKKNIPNENNLTRIPLSQLVLNFESSRIPGMEATEQEIIRLMLDDQRQSTTSKLLSLAKSIVKRGFLPSDPLVVKPMDDERLLVIEGNRRATSMKLSVDSSLLPNEYMNLRSSFETLQDRISKIEPVCYISDDDSELREIMWLRHSGTGNGKVLNSWSSTQKARFFRAIYKAP